MTLEDVQHIAQCLVALRFQVGKVFEEDELDRMIGRFLWAIHSSPGTPQFDEARFHDFVRGHVDSLEAS